MTRWKSGPASAMLAFRAAPSRFRGSARGPCRNTELVVRRCPALKVAHGPGATAARGLGLTECREKRPAFVSSCQDAGAIRDSGRSLRATIQTPAVPAPAGGTQTTNSPEAALADLEGDPAQRRDLRARDGIVPVGEPGKA